MLTDDDVDALAACLSLAHKLDPNGKSSDADIYWHTRESISELIGARRDPGQTRVSLLRRVVNTSESEYAWTKEPALRSRCARFWAEVAHPEVIVAEVLGS